METTWTGAADAPYWDLAANWSAGPPISATTRTLLGGFDTRMRSGVFEADTVEGSGMLTITGGELRIAGGGSRLGRIVGSNAGSLTVREGDLVFAGSPGSRWSNTGTLTVAGGRVTVDSFRGEIGNGGTVDVQAGQMSIHGIGARVDSRGGTWNIVSGAVLEFRSEWGTAPWLPVTTNLDATTFANAGTLRFVGGNMLAALSPSVLMTGRGRVEVLEGAGLTFAGAAELGDLYMGSAFAIEDNGQFIGYVDNRLALVGVDMTLADHAAVLTTSGGAHLDGTLAVQFADTTPSLGSYRLLSAAGGIGYGAMSFETNLDPSLYRVTWVEGGTFLDLTVAAVPEPANAALLTAGVLGPVAATRRRAAHISRCSPALSPPRIT